MTRVKVQMSKQRLRGGMRPLQRCTKSLICPNLIFGGHSDHSQAAGHASTGSKGTSRRGLAASVHWERRSFFQAGSGLNRSCAVVKSLFWKVKQLTVLGCLGHFVAATGCPGPGAATGRGGGGGAAALLRPPTEREGTSFLHVELEQGGSATVTSNSFTWNRNTHHPTTITVLCFGEPRWIKTK